MKKALYFISITAITALIYGYYSWGDIDIKTTHKIIGSGVAALFLLWMPLFIYHRYKDRNVKNYMITDDFFEKIKNEADTFIDKK